MSEVSTATRGVVPKNTQRFEVYRGDEWLETDVEKQEGSTVHIIFREQGSLKRKKMNLDDSNLRIAEAGLQRPTFLAADVTEDMWDIQKNSPTKWAMTLSQWNQVINHCKGTTAWREMKKKKKHVNLYDMKDRFIIPWTRGSGCSVAVLMNKGAPKEATVMLSHAWGEDMEECQSSVNDHFRNEGILPETAVWFCGFAIYQPEDGVEPTIQAQLDLDPFTKVISSELMKTSPGRMLAVHTTGEDLWERLWCVREVREAMDQKVPIRAALSDSYKDLFRENYDLVIENGGTHENGLDQAGITVRTARAKCGRAKDKKMLFKELTQSGKRSLDDVDKTTSGKRFDFLKDLIVEAATSIALNGQPKALLDLAKLGHMEAVDGLHAVAEAGQPKALRDVARRRSWPASTSEAERGSEQAEKARDALCEALECIVQAHAKDIRHAMYILCFKDRRAALELPITLLQSMASRQHQQSVDVLCGIDFKPNYSARPGESGHDSVNVQAWEYQHVQLPLQILAKQGSECAVAAVAALVALVAVAKPSQGNIAARDALKSLAEQWNRQALKALKAMAEEEMTEGAPEESYRDWSRELLKRLEKALCSDW